MTSPTPAQSTDDSGYDLPHTILHELVYRAVMSDRVPAWMPIRAAARQLDECGAIPPKAREVLADAYPGIFWPAHEGLTHQKESNHE